MLWKEGIKVEVQTFSQTHINALGDSGAKVGWCHLTGFYGNQDTGKRPKSWARLKQLKDMSTLPWLTIGDFNEIIDCLRKRVGVLDQDSKCRTSLRPLIFVDYGMLDTLV